MFRDQRANEIYLMGLESRQTQRLEKEYEQLAAEFEKMTRNSKLSQDGL